MDNIIERLNARLNGIKINIAFGEQFRKVYVKDEKFIKKLEASIENQKTYKKEVVKLIESTKEGRNDEAKAIQLLDKDDRSNHTLELLNDFKSSSFENCSSLDIKLKDFDSALANMTSVQEQEGINIVIIGNRGVGKSSFINTLFNVDHYNEKAIKTDANECTMIPTPYTAACFADPYDNNAMQFGEKFVVWDFPGVGTKNFPNSEYREIIKYLPIDSYVYLYEKCFSEVDRDLVSLIQEKNVFLVRTKADNEINLEEVRESLEESSAGASETFVSEQLKAIWEEKKKHCQNDKSIKELLSGELKNISEKFYYISCLNSNREYYDFAQLMKDLLEKLPKEKVEFMLLNLKGRSSAFFLIKNELIKNQIETWVTILIFLLESNSFEAFLKFLMAKLCEVRIVFGLEVNESILSGLVKSFAPQINVDIKKLEFAVNNVDLSRIILKDNLMVGQLEKIGFKKYSDAALKKNPEFAIILNGLLKTFCDGCFKEAINYILGTN